MANTAAQQSSKLTGSSSKIWGVLVCLLGSFLFLAFQGGKLAAMLFTVVLILSVYFIIGRFSGIASAKGVRQLNADKHAEYIAGSSVPVHVQVSLPRAWLFPYIIVKDRLVSHRGETYEFEMTFVPDWRSRGEIRYVTPPLRRGAYRFEDTVCTTEDIFGLFQHHGTIAMPHSFLVYPQTVAIKEWAHFHDLTKGTHHHSTTTRAVRETTQINGVRDYVYGDRISRIHWNATARTGTWKSKEFEKETLPKSVVVLDCDRSAYPDADSFELAVSVAASLFKYGWMNELTLGLLYSAKQPQYVQAARGEAHYKNVMNHLVHVEADGTRTLDGLLQMREDIVSEGQFFIFVSPRSGDALSRAVRVIQSRQMNACQIRIVPNATAAGSAAHRRYHRPDFKTYPIASLSELPIVLGGRG